MSEGKKLAKISKTDKARQKRALSVFEPIMVILFHH
jgi:hypothetical protein